MAASFYKWLIIPVFLMFNSHQVQNRSFFHSKDQHPFYVCVIEINHNTADKTLEISCKIFADDFEKVLTQKHKSVVSISQPKDKATLDNWIKQYITNHLLLKTNGKLLPFTYLGFEKEDDAVFCYLQVDNITQVKKIEAINTMLHDLNQNQVNIMHVTVNGERKSTKLDFPNSEAAFIF